MLGPRWSLKELRTFYILLKAQGQQWDKLEERLPHRSSAMVRALFAMHHGYLSLPEASVEGFCAIMMDHYEMQDKQKMIKNNTKEVNMTIVKQEEFVTRSRKKRRLEKFLTVDQVTTLQIQTKTHEKPLEKTLKRVKQRKSATPTKARASLSDDDMGLSHVHGIQFKLPWSHWFYSYVDADFFSHNEFMECLNRMGLEKITVAARPIWSSVRASMGRPRRLSRLFFAQEKEKLETYRAVKRRVAYRELVRIKRESTDRTWPYRCSPPLQLGMTVIVWVESERRFRFATVAAYHTSKDTCQVSFSGNVLPLDLTEISLDNVMVWTIPPWSGKCEASFAEPKLAATTLLRRENGIRGGAPIFSIPKATNSIGDRHGEKIRAILAVKSLLHRKEKIILSMAKLNKCVAEQQMRLLEKDTTKSSLRTTSTTISSAAIRDLAWTNSRERRQLQKQHSWLAANLNATNKYLKTALLTLQSFSAITSSGADNSDPSLVCPSDSLKCNMMQTETLTEGQIRWAMDFLAASQRKSAIVVAESALQVVKDDKELSSLNSATNETRPGNVLPETMQLVANCVTLMSVLHRHVAASPDVPLVVTQKLVERVLELLKPSHEANMDLYAELHAAADAAQAQMVLQASTSEAD